MRDQHQGSGPDPDVVRAWAAGWAVSRGTPAPTDAGGSHRIAVGLPGHAVRYVVPSTDTGPLRELADEVAAPDVWLKVCAERDAVLPLLGTGWRVDATEYLMAAPLAATARSASAPAGYRLEVEAADGAVDVRVLTEDGRPAASGRVGCAGPDAVYDKIVTEPEHRRRGLGSLVMRRLAHECRASGAERGVLVATEVGLALYRAIGFRLHSPVIPAVFAQTTAGTP